MRINGQEYPIAGIEPKEYLLRVGTFVDERMLEIKKHNRQLSLSQVAVLTSINLADEVIKLMDAHDNLKKAVPLTSDDVTVLRKELEQKNNTLRQEKDYTKNLQKRLNHLKEGQEKMGSEYQEAKKKLASKELELQQGQQVIKDLQEQLYDNQVKVAELQKRLHDQAKDEKASQQLQTTQPGGQ